MSNLIQRTISGAIFITVIIASIVLSYRFTCILFLMFSILAVREYHSLVSSTAWHTAISIVSSICLYMSLATNHYWWSMAFVIVLMAALMAEVIRASLGKASAPVQMWGNLLISQVMIALPFGLAANILNMECWENTRWLLLALFVCIWANDTGAYCVGSLIGKHKMIPVVSPGKTWEGLIGGFCTSLIAGGVFSFFIDNYALWQWLIFAFVVSLFGTFGDLMESLLKRSIGVKDSGKFLPGHGGVLDRFDSFLLAMPAIWLMIVISIYCS